MTASKEKVAAGLHWWRLQFTGPNVKPIKLGQVVQSCEPPPAEDERDIWIVERGKLKRPTDKDDKNPADPEQDNENQS